MAGIQTNFRAEDMLGAKKVEVKKTVAPTPSKKSAPKVQAPEPVVLEAVVEEVAVDVVEPTVEADLEVK